MSTIIPYPAQILFCPPSLAPQTTVLLQTEPASTEMMEQTSLSSENNNRSAKKALLPF